MKRKYPIDPIDFYVGNRLRAARTLRSLSQSYLGSAADVSFQQVQKYESGANRLSASQLVRFAHFLQMPIEWFFEAYKIGAQSSEDTNFSSATLTSPETLKLLHVYYRIADIRQRERAIDILKAMAK